jgi:hypothetical protein
VCVTGADDRTTGGGVVAGGLADAEADAEAVARAVLESLARAVGDVPALAVLVVEEAPSDGDGARLADDVAVPLAGGVGVKTDGTDEPPPVQAETATAMSTAPAAERPAISHAPWAARGLVRHIFMNPPRMRVR